MIVLVGGTGRSGTTLIAQMFQMDPRFAVFIEPRFLIDPGGMLSYLNGEITREDFVENVAFSFRNKMVHNLQRFDILPNAGAVYTEEAIFELAKAVKDTNDRDWCRRFVLRLFWLSNDVLGTKHCVEKTPHSVLYVDQLREVFHNSRFVHVIRDPRDVCASVLPKKWGPKTVEDFVPWYVNIMQLSWEAMQRTNARKYLVVSLEDVVDAPAAKFQVLCRALGVSSPESDVLDSIQGLCTEELLHRGRHETDLSISDAAMVWDGCNGWYNAWQDLSIA